MIWRSVGLRTGPGALCATMDREGGDTVEQSTARHWADTAVPQSSSSTGGVPEWESDLADLSDLPLTDVDDLAPLGPGTRLLAEVLRARNSMTGGNEGTARAE